MPYRPKSKFSVSARKPWTIVRRFDQIPSAEIISRKGLANITVDGLVQEITPKGRCELCCTCMVKVVCMQVCWEMFSWHFSIAVQRNHMTFGGTVAPNSGCLSLTLRLCSSFGFGVVSVLLSRFDAPFKCTVNKTL